MNNPTPAANANGHRRRQLRARVYSEETHCIICGEHVDQTLTQIHAPTCDGNHTNNRPGCQPHPLGPVVDEDIPRKRGGSPLDRNNCHLAHRQCNRDKGDWTLAEYRDRGQATQTTVTTLVAW